MKGKFFAPSSLMQLEETLKEHQSYAVLVVSTTGLDSDKPESAIATKQDDSRFSEHAPVRICLSQFEFDNDLKQYKEVVTFDKLVQAPQAAIEEAIKNSDKYDVFVNDGIDKEAYLKGENVLSPEAFKKEFSRIMVALKEDNAVLILNGGLRHCKHYMEKIDCANEIKEMVDTEKILDQTRLTQEYFQKAGISGNATLENLRNVTANSPSTSFINDKEKMRDFAKLSKEDFLKSYSYLSEKSYDVTAKEVENRNSKIVGGDNRIKVIDNFITKYGRDEKILESDWKAQQRESDVAYTTDLSEKGKKNYKEDNISGKFSTLISSGNIIPEKIMQGESEFHKLMDAASGKNGNKGIVIIHSATTGFESGGVPRSTGFPIQFAAVVYKSENGKLNMDKHKGVFINIAAPARSLARAEENMKKPNGYDTFADANIDLADYKAGKNVESRDEAIKRITGFFQSYPPEEYPIVAIGGTRGTDKSFTQTCLQNLANFPMCNAPHIDFSQVIKEYSFLANCSEEYPKNEMFDEKNMSGKTFSLKDVAEANDIKDIRGATKKSIFVASLINKLEKQQKELFNSEKTVDKKVQPIENSKPNAKPLPELNENEAFIEGNEYNNIFSIEDSKKSQEKIERKAQSEEFIKNIEVVTEGVGGGVASPNKKNDIAPNANKAFKFKRKEAKDESMGRNSKAYDERAKSRKENQNIYRKPDTTPSTHSTSSDVEKLDVNRLVEVIALQSEMIFSQSTIIAEHNTKLFEALKEQNDVLRAVIENDKQPEVQKRAEIAKPIQQAETKEETTNYVDYMETIKEKIGNLKGQIPNGKVGKHLLDANKSLSEGQKEIEQIGQNKREHNLV